MKLWSEEQQSAIDICIDRANRVAGVTGEAGTGKTTILQAVHEGLEGMSICLAAPTGRAAKRISEATGIHAKTIHRMMRYSMPTDDEEYGLPAHNKTNPLPYQCVLIDEASMVNEELYNEVINALPNRAIIRFFGDANQLPPVQGRSPFLRILERFPSVKLTHNFRSDDGVVTAARQILSGRVPQGNDQFHLINPGTSNLFSTINDVVDDSFRTLECQIITPQNTGKFGTIQLNNFFQIKLNPNPHAIRLTYTDAKGNDDIRTFKQGDKVIWTKNDYKLNLFNGMIGFVEDFDEDGNISISFEDRDVVVPPLLESYDNQGRALFSYDPRKNLSLAYAVTTHKAQGSEFQNVLLILTKSYIMNRANFYTAVTRARENVTVICGIGGIAAGLRLKAPADYK